MRRPYFLLTVLLLLLTVAATGQTPAPQRTFTDVLTPQATAGTALTVYKSQVEGYLITDAQDIAGLKAQLIQAQNDIGTLKAQVQAILNPQVSPTTVDFSTLPDGAITAYQGLTFSGTWAIIGGALAPNQDSQPGRSISFPRMVTVTGITFSSVNQVTKQLSVQAPGMTAPTSCLVTSTTAPTTCVPNFPGQISSFTVTSSGGNATDLRIENITFK